MLLGAAGGCLPVMVLARRGGGTMLPYLRWLDWCKLAIIVSEKTAQKSMSESSIGCRSNAGPWAPSAGTRWADFLSALPSSWLPGCRYLLT